MIEKDLEQKLVGIFSALNLQSLGVSGFWQSAALGTVKGLESGENAAELVVRARPLGFESFTLPKADLSVDLSLAVRVELAADGAALADYFAPIDALLKQWQLSISAVKSDLTLVNFAPVGFRLDGGDASFDSTLSAWSVRQSFTVRGIIKEV